MDEYDYIIVGAGSAGCVLAYRLSQSPSHRVLLIEAGGRNDSLLVRMPKGSGKLIRSPRHTWVFQTEAYGDVPSETWLRGKGLGGSSAVNGMMYFRGQPQDYDEWESLGCTGWGWSEMARAFRAIERHELEEDGIRGRDGRLGISVHKRRNPVSEAVIVAGEQLGLPRKADLNQPDQEGVGYASWTISEGRRQSAAYAFLEPCKNRPNLKIVTGVTIDRIRFEGNRAVAVVGRRDGEDVEFPARGEIILSCGALQTPKLLQLSGVGPAPLLSGLGIPVVRDHPGVGAHMLEHRLLMMQFRLLQPLSYNREFSGPRLVKNMLKYLALRKGVMAEGSYEVAAFVRSLSESDRPDAEILMTPYSMTIKTNQVSFEKDHGLHMFGYPLRSRSEGEIRIRSADPDEAPAIRPNYLTDPYDQKVTLGMVRYIRQWMAHLSLEGLVGREEGLSAQLQTDADIIDGFRRMGQAGFHACGTCRMGNDPDAVLDPKARVVGLSHLRVVDGSMMPTMVSANTNGPIMAMAWRAADFLLQ